MSFMNKTGRPRKYPEMWICQMCGQKFANKTGRPRKYCSQRCYGRLLNKRVPETAFKAD